MPVIPAIVAATPALIGAGSSIIGGVVQSKANKGAAQAQAGASKYAADIQDAASRRAEEAAREQLDYDRWLTQATGEARKPYLEALTAALGQGPGFGNYQPGTYTPGTFKAPTQAEAEADPGYQSSVAEGQRRLEGSAAARGSLLTSGTLRDVQQYGQNRAAEQYDKVYGRRMGEFAIGEQGRAVAFDRNESGRYNAANLSQSGAQSIYGSRLSSLAAMAQMAAPGTYPGYGGRGVTPGERVGLDEPDVKPEVYRQPDSLAGGYDDFYGRRL